MWAAGNKKRRRASQLAGVAILKSYLKLQCVFIMKTNIIVSDAYPFGGGGASCCVPCVVGRFESG